MAEPDTISTIKDPNSTEVWNTIKETELKTIQAQRPRNRMTTVETVTYEREDGEPFQVQTKCWRLIEQDTQPYQREILATEEWKPIDLGWAAEWNKIGTISLQHLGEKSPQKVLTSEEKLERASKTLYVTLGSVFDAYLEVFPLDSFRAILSDPRALRIRSKIGTVRLLLTIFPA